MTGTTPHPVEGFDKNRMHDAAEMLLTARRTLVPIRDLPPDLRPRSIEQAYFLQDLLLEALGELGGWKVGAPAPDATPLYAPMPFYTFAHSGDVIANRFRRMRGVEAEIAFLLGKDLPARAQPYSREEVTEAIASCHPAIELLESALLDPAEADRLTVIGDLQMHGGFVHGNAAPEWRQIDFAAENASMAIDGVMRVENGKNPAGGDLLRLLVWLANQAQHRTGGLFAGQWITTGSWTGRALADSGSEVEARFDHAGVAVTRFA